MGLDRSVDSWDLFLCTSSLIYMRGVSECIFSNLLSECFSSAVPGWLGLREPDTWNQITSARHLKTLLILKSAFLLCISMLYST